MRVIYAACIWITMTAGKGALDCHQCGMVHLLIVMYCHYRYMRLQYQLF